MVNIEITKQDTLNQLISKYMGEPLSLELLRFFGIHPCARFNWPAVTHALDFGGGKSEVERALVNLTDQGVVKVNIDHDTPIYSLTQDESTRRQVIELAKLDWSRWQLVLRKGHAIPVVRGNQHEIVSLRSEDNLVNKYSETATPLLAVGS